MQFLTPLTKGLLIKRYKRFLADIRLEDGSIITAHCPNTGTMLGCSTPGCAVFLSKSNNLARKYQYTLEMTQNGTIWVGVNTARTNTLVVEAIRNGQIAEFANIDAVVTEVKTSCHTRLDIQVIKGTQSTFVEVKNCSLAINGCAMFPDAVTSRGSKHLHELIRLVEDGFQATIFFLVQRMDADRFSPANEIDPNYGKTLYQAIASGVQVLIYQAQVSPEGIHVVRALPFVDNTIVQHI
ncbi:MAG: DNA/RNA nuclease SfsA [Desulforhopalus sp.]|nr:DNA/RNA nuclease SfsA [Desulforhopalus sp.]